MFWDHAQKNYTIYYKYKISALINPHYPIQITLSASDIYALFLVYTYNIQSIVLNCYFIKNYQLRSVTMRPSENFPFPGQ